MGAEVKRTVLEKFSQREEVLSYSKKAREGLWEPEIVLIKRWFEKGGLVLNIGCGAGRESFGMERMGFSCIGIDISLPMIKEAIRLRGESSLFLVADACSLCFSDETFSYATMVNQLICYIPRRKSRVSALREVYRVLKPKGRLILSVCSKYRGKKHTLYWSIVDRARRISRLFGIGDLEEGDRYTRTVVGGGSRKRCFIHYYTQREVREDLESAGFGVEECRADFEIAEGVCAPERRELANVIYLVGVRR
jgi:ubiquinone/menaquinone biosynthesis C-methylase UbiE